MANYDFNIKAIAKGPKLSFPEFEGTDLDGWIRLAEKYFELVGVANEDRVQFTVLYIKGKAEFWWRSIGSIPANVHWHMLCRMVGNRFSDTSTYEVVGQFHTLKQLGSITEYIDKFEELTGLVKRDNLLTVYFGAPSMFITLWFGFDYGTNPPLGTLII
jgi:hypothetical protein